MAYQYTTINGQRVEKTVAAAFQKMRAAFKKQFGLDLLVSSGTRTRAEQKRLYDLWIAGKGSLAARPGQSNHEEYGPTGPRALDLRDTGRDSGVTVIGSTRSNWLAANAPRFGFKNAGHYFRPREGWHYEYTGALGKHNSSSTGTKETKVKTYHNQDKDSRAKGRSLKPGEAFYLNTKANQKTSQATNVVGGVGPYSFAVHVYADGQPGDSFDVVLVWDSPKKGDSHSQHYTERVEIGSSGSARINVPFQRAVPSGYAVYARLQALHSNKKGLKVTVFDVDAYLYVGA